LSRPRITFTGRPPSLCHPFYRWDRRPSFSRFHSATRFGSARGGKTSEERAKPKPGNHRDKTSLWDKPDEPLKQASKILHPNREPRPRMKNRKKTKRSGNFLLLDSICLPRRTQTAEEKTGVLQSRQKTRLSSPPEATSQEMARRIASSPLWSPFWTFSLCPLLPCAKLAPSGWDAPSCSVVAFLQQASMPTIWKKKKKERQTRNDSATAQNAHETPASKTNIRYLE
jgi:hypothetical protein